MYKHKQAINGVKIAWYAKYKVVCMSLVIVVGVQAWAPVMPTPEAIQYVADTRHSDTLDLELDTYINKVQARIFESNQHVYNEMARQEAIQEVGRDLIELSDNSPYVDYDYMREVVANMQ